jgi:hypothetical protein
VHHGALFTSVRKDAPRHVAKGCLGQAALDGVIQFQDGRHGLAQNTVTAEDFSDVTWFHVVSLYQMKRIR